MTTKKPSFSALRVNRGAEPHAPAPAPEPVEPVQAARAAVEPAPRRVAAPRKREDKGVKLGKTIPVRLTHEQWYEAKEFAMRQDQSLQELFIKGINTLRAAKGLPPLTGTHLS